MVDFIFNGFLIMSMVFMGALICVATKLLVIEILNDYMNERREFLKKFHRKSVD